MDHNASSATDLAPLFAAAKAAAAPARSATLGERLARRAVLGRMRHFGHGRVMIAEDGAAHAIGAGGPEAYVQIHDPATWTANPDRVITEKDFRALVYENPYRFYTANNPDFFKGTKVEEKLQAQAAAA